MDYFELFGLPRRLAVNEEALQRRFYDLSRQHHPDFHQGGSPEDQARVLTTSAHINAAYRVLRDPIRRVDYLIRLEEGREPGAEGVKAAAPPGLLAEMFEIQEALQEAKAGGLDEGAQAALRGQRDELVARCQAEEARVRGPLSRAWDAATSPAERSEARGRLKEALATCAYLQTVIEDLTQVLEGQAEHVAHHRH